MTPAPRTSIVVRTLNEARHLPKLIDALNAQTDRDFETIVVDSGSIDGTPELASRAGFRVLRLDPEHFTFGYSLNTGIEAAQGRYVAIVSAHAIPTGPDWLAALIAPFADDQVAMVYGRQLGAQVSKFSEAQDFRRRFGTRRRTLKPPECFANNANSAIQRKLWEKYQFDAALPGLEDIDWARHWMAKSKRVVYEPDAAVFHIHEETRRQVTTRYYREAVAARRMGLHGPARIPLELLRESAFFLSDLTRAFASAASLARPLTSCLAEIAAFRFDKTTGTVRGLLNAEPGAGATRSSVNFESSYEAVIVDSPHHASLQRVPMPAVRPGDAVVEVAYVGICGTDIEIMNGTLGYFSTGLGEYPVIPGHEVSGRVVAVGPAVTKIVTGDRVVIECIQGCGTCPECQRQNPIGCSKRSEMGVLRSAGGYARYVVVPARFLHRIPDSVSLRQAALCEPLAVVLKGIDRLSRAWAPQPVSRRILVVGGGTIGRLTALVLAGRGHSLSVSDRDPNRLTDLGSPTITPRISLDDLTDFDDLIEATGDALALEPILAHSKPGANILLLGLPYSRKPFSFESVVAFDKTVVGSVGSAAEHFDQAVAMIGTLKLDAFLKCAFPLDRFEDAWDTFRRRETLKVMLEVGPPEVQAERLVSKGAA